MRIKFEFPRAALAFLMKNFVAQNKTIDSNPEKWIHFSCPEPGYIQAMAFSGHALMMFRYYTEQHLASPVSVQFQDDVAKSLNVVRHRMGKVQFSTDGCADSDGIKMDVPGTGCIFGSYGDYHDALPSDILKRLLVPREEMLLMERAYISLEQMKFFDLRGAKVHEHNPAIYLPPEVGAFTGLFYVFRWPTSCYVDGLYAYGGVMGLLDSKISYDPRAL